MPDSGPNIRYVIIHACNPKQTCSGKVTDELNVALNARARAAHRCYDAALEQDGTLKGHLGVTVRIAANGRMCSAAITDNDMGTNAVASWVQNTFARTGSMPIPRGLRHVKLPISFVPGGK